MKESLDFNGEMIMDEGALRIICSNQTDISMLR
jgi:hypothetical protein